MLVITRHVVPIAEAAEFLERARRAVEVLAARPGWVAARIARAMDDPESWTITMEWQSVGAYRRALSAYEVRVDAVPLLSTAKDEPTAYEVIYANDRGAVQERGSDLAADAGTVGLGEAAGPRIPTDL